MSDEWRSVEGYEGLYEISSEGKVRSLHKRSLRILRPGDRRGYLRVDLCRGDGSPPRHWSVHVLVARAFLGPAPEGSPQVRHLDGDRHNNRAVNLAYGTNSDNTLDMVRHGRHFCANKTHCKHGHEFTPENTYYYGQGRYCRTCRRQPRPSSVRRGRRPAITNQSAAPAHQPAHNA